jgi:transcription antitermination protein NusB
LSSFKSKDYKLSTSRRKSRELALQILYQIELTNQRDKEVVPLFFTQLASHKTIDDFADCLVQGVGQYQEEIDELLKEYLEHWALERLSSVDRNILRMGIFEILWCKDIPSKVSINEAIELGKKFGTEKSASFINGILDKIAHSEKQK